MDHDAFTPTVEERQRTGGHWLAEQPICTGLAAGTVTEDQLRDWTKQFFVTVTRVMRLAHARPKLPAHLFDPEMKKYMWENRVEEEYGALSDTAGHVELMLRLAERLGISRLDMATAEVAPETRHLLEFVRQVCEEQDVLHSQIMLGFVEAMMPEACQVFTDALQANYRMSADDTRFFSVHIFADEEHGDIAKRMVALVPADQLDELADTVMEYTTRFTTMWAGPLLEKVA